MKEIVTKDIDDFVLVEILDSDESHVDSYDNDDATTIDPSDDNDIIIIQTFHDLNLDQLC
uniref:Uncharacterized protein n=1 Tax=viral metagenome TaxID=1070528 RepID=A0A6C0F891_9ZZZZ